MADGSRVDVTDVDPGIVYAIDANPASSTFDSVIGSFAVGSAPGDIAISPEGTRIYVVKEGDGTITVNDVTLLR